MLGYVVGLSRKTQIKNPKRIIEILDTAAVLDKNMLSLTKALSQYYCCSWGEAIETALPQSIREGSKIQGGSLDNAKTKIRPSDTRELILIHDSGDDGKWDIYLEKIKQAQAIHESVIVLFPDLNALLKARERIAGTLGVEPVLLYRKQTGRAREWQKIKEGKTQVVLATRSGIFAPSSDVGLVIIDSEHDQAYKQDQVPHYHAREMAFMRSRLGKASLILESATPSLESMYLAKKHKMSYMFLPRKTTFPEIKIVDMRYASYSERKKNLFFSRYLEDALGSVLNAKGKILLFLNRKGFSTFAYCHSCAVIQKCPRCNVNLVYHFSLNLLACRRCNFKIEPPKICPHCNSGYIKYSGAGTEKIESELSRMFPAAVIKRLDEPKDFNPSQKSPEAYSPRDECPIAFSAQEEASGFSPRSFTPEGIDIFVSTSAILKQAGSHFDLIAVLAIDDSLNRVDFRAAEKAFALLVGLLRLTDKKMIIQTGFPGHSCFQALLNKDVQLFYKEELRQRKQLNYPPYKHMVLVKLRGKKEERVKVAAEALFKRLRDCNQHKDIRILSVNPGQPSKLRGNFYWQLLIIAKEAEKASRFLKITLKDFLHSGIIVTVDVDPL